MELLKQLPPEDKLNVILENMSLLGLLTYRIDNIGSTAYLNCAKHEASDERIRLLEYKQIVIEARNRKVNIIISGVIESPGENCVDIVTDIIDNNLKLDSLFIICHYPCQ